MKQFSQVEQADCNLCRANSLRQIEEGPLPVVKCRRCGLVYVNPRPTMAELSKYYSDGYYSDWFIAQQVTKLAVYKQRLDKVERYIQRGKLLDVGAGLGIFLELAKEDGWEVYGTEISDYALLYLKSSFGYSNIFSGFLEEVDIHSESFDVVTLWHVLEHTTDPLGCLTRVKRILKKSGLVFVAVPNVSSLFLFFRRLFRRESQFLFTEGSHEPHLYFFSPRTIKKMVAKAGFKVVENSLDNLWLGQDISWKLRLFIRLTEVIYALMRVNVADTIFICGRKES